MRATLSILGLYNYCPNIFNDMLLPDGLDRQTVIDSILLEAAELEILYPEPDTLRAAIRLWSSRELPGWRRIQRALEEDYNPVHNYDRHEEWTDTGKAKSSSSAQDQTVGWNTGPGPADRGKSTGTAESTSEAGRAGHVYGNIGVTMGARMVAAEVAVRQELSMIDIIVQSFISHLTLMVF